MCSALQKLIEERGGKPWDTVKPLHRYFADLSRVLLVDDSPHKSLPAEAANMLVMPRYAPVVVGGACGAGARRPLRRAGARRSLGRAGRARRLAVMVVEERSNKVLYSRKVLGR